MNLNEVVPWGRTMAEYQWMFDLSDADLDKKILGCGDGPASFNVEMTRLGSDVVSIDPIYQFSGEQIEQRVRSTYESIIAQVRQNSDRYIWSNFANPDELGRARLAAMNAFLLDYEIGKIDGRYLNRSLPNLYLNEYQFDLCLCSHLLFLYSEQLSLDFHIKSILELLKICKEIRIFPLLTLDCKPSPYLDPVIKELVDRGFKVQIQLVEYEFQKGGNRMLKIQN
jgi:hypothetical protein